ncbi:MAG: hypothetical protein CVV47_10085 [Spirochaetae bacterium HGW-Spirochaetae-3]|jgi:predicted amino acid racemase|nr:MAG: hypothetical protein CVV47_10085 [Spirochaetae bacterium HGW-Spirochaetae-3]
MYETVSPGAGRYPRVSINLQTIEFNARAVVSLCADSGVRLVGVVKGAGALIPVAAAMARGGCSALASSRLSQLRALRDAMGGGTDGGTDGIPSGLPLGLLRIPGPSEVAEAVAAADWSLQSDATALGLTATEAGKVGRRHGVTLMLDLGDLREGWFDEGELVAQAVRVERELPSLYLRGVGTNLGCYGSIRPTPENLGRLVSAARRVEDAIGRRLDVVSGGATSSLPLIVRGDMPHGVTELRVGEGMLCARDLPCYHGTDVPGVRSDAFTLRAEIVEIRKKPSYPVGERCVDAFGRCPDYDDRGERTRLLLAVGKRDFGDHAQLVPRDIRVRIIGSSSDHLICEADEPCADLRYGSILEFDLFYGAMLFLCDGDPYVGIEYVRVDTASQPS